MMRSTHCALLGSAAMQEPLHGCVVQFVRAGGTASV